MVNRTNLVAAVVAIAGSTACSNVLGIDRGTPEVDAGDDDVVTAAQTSPDASRPDALVPPDDSGSTADVPTSTDAFVPPDDSGSAPDVHIAPDVSSPPVDASPPPTDAPACRATLQPCSTATDCCSGVCGLNLTCL